MCEKKELVAEDGLPISGSDCQCVCEECNELISEQLFRLKVKSVELALCINNGEGIKKLIKDAEKIEEYLFDF